MKKLLIYRLPDEVPVVPEEPLDHQNELIIKLQEMEIIQKELTKSKEKNKENSLAATSVGTPKKKCNCKESLRTALMKTVKSTLFYIGLPNVGVFDVIHSLAKPYLKKK